MEPNQVKLLLDKVRSSKELVNVDAKYFCDECLQNGELTIMLISKKKKYLTYYRCPECGFEPLEPVDEYDGE